MPWEHDIRFPFNKKFLWQKPKSKYAYTGIKQSSLCNFFHLENRQKLKEHKNDLLLLPHKKSVFHGQFSSPASAAALLVI